MIVKLSHYVMVWEGESLWFTVTFLFVYLYACELKNSKKTQTDIRTSSNFLAIETLSSISLPYVSLQCCKLKYNIKYMSRLTRIYGLK